MNRRSLFKTLAALPLSLLIPLKARPMPAPALYCGIDLSGVFASGTDFVPGGGLAYLHRGEPTIKRIYAHDGKLIWADS